MYYRSNRNFFKNWLGNTNLKPYILIMLVVLLVVGGVLLIGGNHIGEYFMPNETTAWEDLTEEKTQPTEGTIQAVLTTEVKKGFEILVNKFDNTVTVYRTENGEKTEIERTMPASVNSNLADGQYELSEKTIWRTIPGNTFVQYSSKSATEILFHSPVYELQNRSYMNVETYRMIGSSNDTVEGITLTVADSKWIFENCDMGTIVEVVNDSSRVAEQKPEPPMEVPDGIRWDPTDPARGNVWIPGKVEFLTGVTDKVISVGEYLDPWDGIYARAVDGTNVTDNVIIHNYVNNQVPGVYGIEYIIADTTGQVIRQYSNVTVLPVEQTTAETTTESEGESTQETSGQSD